MRPVYDSGLTISVIDSILDPQIDALHSQFRNAFLSEQGYVPFSHDLTLLRELYRTVQPFTGEHRVLIARDPHYNNDVVGILPVFSVAPFKLEEVAPASAYVLGEDRIINFHPMVLPQYYIRLMQHCPPYVSTDMSPMFSAEVTERDCVCTFPYSVIRPLHLSDYMQQQSKSVRKDCERLLRKCGEFRIDYGNDFPEGYEELFMEQEEYRAAKDESYIAGFKLEAVRQIRDPRLWTEQQRIMMIRARDLGWLRSISMYDGDKLISVNLAVHEGNVLSDYITIRSHDPKYLPYSLGIVNILLNIQWAYNLGCHSYDLGPNDSSMTYKRKFPAEQVEIIGYMHANILDLIETEMLGNCKFPMRFNEVWIDSMKDVRDVLSMVHPAELEALRKYIAELEPKAAQALHWQSVIEELGTREEA